MVRNSLLWILAVVSSANVELHGRSFLTIADKCEHYFFKLKQILYYDTVHDAVSDFTHSRPNQSSGHTYPQSSNQGSFGRGTNLRRGE